MSRFLAAFYHLLISLIVFFPIAYFIVFVWYPGVFFTTDGGWQGVRLIIAVHLVLGPLLTLIVFKAGKPGLKFDLACIGTLQAVCLTAGTYVVYIERPLTMIYYDNYMYSASADTFKRYEQPVPAFDSQSPVLIAAVVPEDPIAKADLLNDIYNRKLPVWIVADTYEPMSDHIDKILENAYDYEQLEALDKDNHLDSFLSSAGGSLEDYAFYPLHSRYMSNNFIALRRSDAEFVGVLPIEAPLYGRKVAGEETDLEGKQDENDNSTDEAPVEEALETGSATDDSTGVG